MGGVVGGGGAGLEELLFSTALLFGDFFLATLKGQLFALGFGQEDGLLHVGGGGGGDGGADVFLN